MFLFFQCYEHPSLARMCHQESICLASIPGLLPPPRIYICVAFEPCAKLRGEKTWKIFARDTWHKCHCASRHSARCCIIMGVVYQYIIGVEYHLCSMGELQMWQAIYTSGKIISSKWKGDSYRDGVMHQKGKKQGIITHQICTKLHDTIPISLFDIKLCL